MKNKENIMDYILMILGAINMFVGLILNNIPHTIIGAVIYLQGIFVKEDKGDKK